MKYKAPEYLESVTDPVEGELALRKNFPHKLIVGIDEVGRGPLAGPVVACAAVLNDLQRTHGLNDSKKLTRAKREAMFDAVKEDCLCYAIASASSAEIDEMNILAADFLAMRRALSALGFPGLKITQPELPVELNGSFPAGADILCVVDGNLKITGVPENQQLAVIKGDGRVACVSAASILAKVYRDRLMDKYAETYPGYGFEVNAGYGTAKHLEAIRKLGFTPVHRRSFHPKALQTELL